MVASSAISEHGDCFLFCRLSGITWLFFCQIIAGGVTVHTWGHGIALGARASRSHWLARAGRPRSQEGASLALAGEGRTPSLPGGRLACTGWRGRDPLVPRRAPRSHWLARAGPPRSQEQSRWHWLARAGRPRSQEQSRWHWLARAGPPRSQEQSRWHWLARARRPRSQEQSRWHWLARAGPPRSQEQSRLHWLARARRPRSQEQSEQFAGGTRDGVQPGSVLLHRRGVIMAPASQQTTGGLVDVSCECRGCLLRFRPDQKERSGRRVVAGAA